MKTEIFQPRYVIPSVILMAFLIDLATRFCSITPLSFTATEALCRFRTPFGAFEPDKKLTVENAFGVLSLRLPAFRHFKKETFSSDSLGYRNKKIVDRPAIILTGSSFSAGFGVDDDETLSTQLSNLLNEQVYNTAQLYLVEPRDDGILLPLFQPDAERIIKDCENLGVKNGLVIYEYPERATLPLYPEENVDSPLNQSKIQLSRWAAKNGQLSFLAHLEGWMKISPAARFCQIFHDDISYKLNIPNQFEKLVCVRQLTNRDITLFHYSGRSKIGQWRDASKAAEYLDDLARKLKNHGLRLLVVMVPTKFRVYQGLLAGSDRMIYCQYPTYFSNLQKELHGKQIDSIDLTDTMIAEAKKAFESGKYLYFLDDEHWTPLGIKVTAEEIRNHLKNDKNSH